MLGPALSWPRVPEDRVTPGHSLAALTAPIPPAVLEAKVTPRGGGGLSIRRRGTCCGDTVQAQGRDSPPDPTQVSLTLSKDQHQAVGTEMHTLQGAGPAEHLGR